MGKDVAEDVVGMHGAGDFPEVVKGLTRIDSNQVTRNAVPESVTDRLQRGLGRSQRFEMAQIGDHELMALVVVAVLLEKSFSQFVESLAR